MTAAAGLNLHSLAQASSERMLNCTLEGMASALLAWILLRALGRQISGTRFAVWFSALLGIAALPLIGHLGSSGAELTKRAEITLSASWALYIFVGWALIAAAGLVRVGIGFLHLHRLRKSSKPIDLTALDPLLRKTLEGFDSPRPVALCLSARSRVPTAIGFVKPRVVIPAWTLQELSAMELNTILLHELAHLQRWDDWTNLVQKIVGALLFFHPAVWWIDKRLALEREMACDDLVLAKTASPRLYAECLVSLAEKSFLRRGVALAQAAVNRVRHVSLRVSQILDLNRPGTTRVWRPAPVLLAGVSLACLTVFSYTPRLVSFDRDAASAPLAGSATMNIPASIGSQASGANSHLIPAKFVVKPAAKSLMSAGGTTKAGAPAIVPAKATQRRVKQPMLIRSSVTDDAIAPQTLILVMRTGQYDASGSVVWDLCVWQVTVIGLNQDRAGQGIVVKVI
jgi:Zn-dependent protease with chaperone function